MFFSELIPAAIVIAILYLLVSNARLKRRITALELNRSRDDGQVAADASTGGSEPELAGETAEPATDTQTPAPLLAPEGDIAAVLPGADVWSRTSKAPDEVSTTQTPAAPSKSVVFNREKIAALWVWLKENWFYAVSALSLALAGVFLVQYGNEQGLLPPLARVWAAIVFGITLIGAGEYVRRRFGDETNVATAYLPSTFSGAGVVTLFAGVLSARLLYGLISPEMTLICLIAVAVVALVLGWFYGPFLAAVGLIGAMIAPFLVGGESEIPEFLYGYFALVSILGLAIDTIRRWAWVSALALILGFSAGGLLYFGGAEPVGLVALAVALALAAFAIPVLRLFPNHSGSMVVQSLPRLRAKLGLPHAPWPEFSTFLAAGSMLAASVVAFIVALDSAQSNTLIGFWPIVIALAVLFAAVAVWSTNAPALADLAVLPIATLFVVISIQSTEGGAVWSAFQAARERLPEDPFPSAATAIMALGAMVSLFAVWRSFVDQSWRNYWGGLAVVIAPAVVVLLEVFWQPANVIGAYPWAWHGAAIAIAMMLLAERYGRRDGTDHLRSAMAILASLAMISFACVVLLSTTALTLSLAITVLAAAVMDRRFNLPLLSVFIQAGVLVIGYRLLIDPGLIWATEAPIFEVILAFGGAIAAFIAAHISLGSHPRAATKTMLESAILANAGVLVSVLITRWIDGLSYVDAIITNWSFSLNAMIWMCVAFAQFYRVRSGGALALLRKILGTLFGGVAAILLGLSVTVANPLIGWTGDVLGPVIFNTLLVAYLLPALLLGAAAKYLWPHRRKTALAMNVVAALLAILYIGLAIRHYWQGPDLSEFGTTQPELYSYTVALLFAGALLLYQSIARRAPGLRKAAMLVIAISVVKVFFIDISGLQGLTRVFSLLALGLSLAGLAWLNRWASARGDDPERPENDGATEAGDHGGNNEANNGDKGKENKEN